MPPPAPTTTLTPAEWARLAAWRRTHGRAVGLRAFTAAEQGRLVFAKWLYSTGRVEP